MAFNIAEWTARVAGTFVYNNKYDVIITFPAGSTFAQSAASSSTARMITDRCIQAVFPGQSIRASEANRYGVGIREKMAFTTAFTDMPLTFIADNVNGDTTHNFWKSWLEFIASTNGNAGRNGYTLEYKDNYAATIQINKYALDGSIIDSIYVFRAFPISMNDAAVSWIDTNKLLTYTVILSYVNWSFSSTGSF